MSVKNGDNGAREPLLSGSGPLSSEREVLQEEAFKRVIAVERKRTERSAKPFLLMLLETGENLSTETSRKILTKAISALLASIRETDFIGWYRFNSCAGVVFTQLVMIDQQSILSIMLGRIGAVLRENLGFEQFSQISISFHFFPDKWDHDRSQSPGNPTLYPDLPTRGKSIALDAAIKRTMDIVGSTMILILLSPVLVLIAVAVKVSTKGPILFRQSRVGQYGKAFTFLKFRSMYVDNDPTVHKNYVTKLIAGRAEVNLITSSNKNAGLYKLTNDKRVTPVGAILRRTSLDELPQLVNVLKGEMSLVGPRPAIPYEVAAYQTWHRRRVLEVKPGITGLWQVNGRCQVKFDDMVRLDLRYAKNWSPWLDLKILLRTPRAVIFGGGAC